MVIGDRLRALREQKESFPGSHRKTNGPLTLLSFTCRVRAHRSIYRNAGEMGSRSGGAALSNFLRRREPAYSAATE